MDLWISHTFCPGPSSALISFGAWALINVFSSRSSPGDRAARRAARSDAAKPRRRSRQDRHGRRRRNGRPRPVEGPAAQNRARAKRAQAADGQRGLQLARRAAALPGHQVRHDGGRLPCWERLRPGARGVRRKKAGPRSSSGPASASICRRCSRSGSSESRQEKIFLQLPDTRWTCSSSAWRRASDSTRACGAFATSWSTRPPELCVGIRHGQQATANGPSPPRGAA